MQLGGVRFALPREGHLNSCVNVQLLKDTRKNGTVKTLKEILKRKRHKEEVGEKVTAYLHPCQMGREILRAPAQC